MLDHFMFSPPTLNIIWDRDDLVPNDPTIIPFSNWLFYGPNGEWQPWRKRTRTYRYDSGGQEAEYNPPSSDLAFYWTSPLDLALDIHLFTPADTDAEGVLYGGGGQGSTREHGTRRIHYRSYNIEDVTAIPTQLNLGLQYTLGDWERVATATLESRFPVGDEHLSIIYLGAPRPDSPAMRYAQQIEQNLEDGLRFDNRFTLEIQTRENHRRSGWRYRVECFTQDDERLPMGGIGDNRGQDHFRLSRIALAEIDRVEIQRKKIHSLRLSPINLSPLENLGPRDLTQDRIEVTPEHRFGETAEVQITIQGDEAKPLLDLDTVNTYELNRNDLGDEDLAQVLEEYEIDLMLYRDEGRDIIRMCASPAYFLGLGDADYWDRSPTSCLQRIRDEDSVYRDAEFIIAAEADEEAVWLTTTSDGTMALFRIVEVAPADAEKPGQVTLEVRRLVEPH